MARLKVGVLISGRGSNLAALLDACARPDYPAHIVHVVSNRPDAGGLDHARAHGVATTVIDHRGFADRAAFDAAMEAVLVRAGVDLICLAGFMRLLSPGFVGRWAGSLINIHPSLLPAFKGLDPHGQALAAGVRLSGASVHFVTAETDAGPIIAQAAVPVLASDGPSDLAARILAAEHVLYPHALALVASGAVVWRNGAAAWNGDAVPPAPLVWPPTAGWRG